MSAMRSFKSATLKQFKVHVERLITAHDQSLEEDVDSAMFVDETAARRLRALPWNDNSVVAFFRSQFNSANFVFCVAHIKGLIDIDTSSKRGKAFLEHIYVNLCMYAKRVNDATREKRDFYQKKFQKHYNVVTLHEHFNSIAKEDFTEMSVGFIL